MEELELPLDLKRSSERVGEVPGTLALTHASLLKLGVPFLDEALLGLIPSDLMLIGAKSGKGKTQMCLEIAKSLALQKKRVAFFALEAEQNEMEHRLLYQIETALLLQKNPKAWMDHRIDYRSWRMGLLTRAISPIREEAMALFKENYATLATLYRGENFGIKELEASIERLKKWAEIVVIDHFHYFDLESGEQKWRLESNLIKQMRAMNLYSGIPFVVAVHTKPVIHGLVPEQEEIAGSSDIYKNATIITMLSPRPQGFDTKTMTAETIMTVPKARTGGLGNLAGILYFSLRDQAYSPKWRLARVMPGAADIKELAETDYPYWAKKGERI